MDYTYDFEFINTYLGTRSPTGTVEHDLTTFYFFRSLYQRALSIVDFELPEGWNKNYFKNVLFGAGYIGIIKTAKYGIIPQLCTLSGYGLYLQPTTVLVAQPLVQFEGERGNNCEVIKLTPDYRGICDIIEHYAVQLSKIYTSILVSLNNSRLGLMAFAKNKSASETLKQVAEKLSSGEPLIIVDSILKDNTGIDGNNDPIFMQTFDVASSYITDKLINDFNSILTAFDREIGIPIIDDKKERRISTEVEMITNDSCARADTWEEALTESIKDTLKVFPELDIDFKFKKGVVDNVAYTETNNDRTLPV